jgi:hypothetical protein
VMRTLSNIQVDYIASHIRMQLLHLRSLLDSIEKDEKLDCDYTQESLKTIETGLRQIRRLCTEN